MAGIESGNNQNVCSDKHELKPEQLFKAAYSEDKGALDCFRQEFRKLTNSQQMKFIDSASDVAHHHDIDIAVDHEAAKNKDFSKRALFSVTTDAKDGTLHDLSITTMETTVANDSSQTYSNVKDIPLFDKGDAKSAELASATKAHEEVAPYVDAYHVLKYQTQFDGQGFTGENLKEWHRQQNDRNNKYEINGYDIIRNAPMTQSQEKEFFGNFVKTAQSYTSPGFFDAQKVADLRQQINQGGWAPVEVAGLTTPDQYLAAKGEINGIYAKNPLPKEFGEKIEGTKFSWLDIHDPIEERHRRIMQAIGFFISPYMSPLGWR